MRGWGPSPKVSAMWSKGCPKCGGDLYEDRWLGDSDVKCLQCGYVLPVAQARALLMARHLSRAQGRVAKAS